MRSSIVTQRLRINLSATALSLCLIATQASAAIVCAAKSGTYGAISVTVSGTNCTPGTLNTSFGIVYAALNTNGSFCEFSFSPAVSGTGLYSGVIGHGPSDELAFTINSTPYAITAAEVDTSTTPPDSPGGLYASGGILLSTQQVGNGRVKYLSAPSSVTTVRISMPAAGSNGSGFNVCFDDGTSVAPAVATPIPTLSEWAMILMLSLMAMVAAYRLRRN